MPFLKSGDEHIGRRRVSALSRIVSFAACSHASVSSAWLRSAGRLVDLLPPDPSSVERRETIAHHLASHRGVGSEYSMTDANRRNIARSSSCG